MISEKDLKCLIERFMTEYAKENSNLNDMSSASPKIEDNIDDADIKDITAKPIQEIFYVPNPENKEEYMKLKAKTPARLEFGEQDVDIQQKPCSDLELTTLWLWMQCLTMFQMIFLQSLECFL